MLLLSCKGITRGYDANWLFEDLSCEIPLRRADWGWSG
jgi:hypothetical protein